MNVRHLIEASVLLLMISSPAFPQTPAASFEELIAAGVVEPQETVYVTDVWGHRVKYKLGGVVPGSLLLIDGSRQFEMPEANVNRIQLEDSIQNGLWLGVGAGVATAWAAPHLTCDLPDDECASVVFLGIGLPAIAAGAVVGALVDRAIKRTVFQFSGTPGSARIQVSPLLGGRRVGALATIRF